MDDLMARIAAKKAELDRLRPVVGAGLGNLEHVHDLELTYTSNAIEGNMLSAAETALVIEQGITIGGKPLKDHLEAIDHYDAIRYVRALGRRGTPLTEADLRQLHHLVVQRSQPEVAGCYADQGRYVLTETGQHTFPSPTEVPPLMGDFARWLGVAPDTPETAFAAHRRLVDIHPFNGQRSHRAASDESDLDPRRLPGGCRTAGRPARLCPGPARGTGRPRVGALRPSSLRAIGRDFGGIFERRQRGPPGPGRGKKIAGHAPAH
jgi:Fic/DOC family